MKINIKFFCKLVVSFLLVITRHAQSSQKSKFVVSLQYLEKEGSDEVDFLHADKHQIIQQVDTINPIQDGSFWGCSGMGGGKVTILMMSAKMATPGHLKIKIF